MKALILEDDLLIALEYEMLLQSLGIELLATCKNIASALSAIKKQTPDFIILDLHISESENGFNFIEQVKSIFIPFIVITGYPKDSFLLKAHEFNAESFLVKPVDKHTLKFEVEKLCKRIKQENKDKKHIFIKDKKGMAKVPYCEIIWIDIDGNYSTIYTPMKRFILKKSLSKVLSSLNSEKFKQVHRSAVVNIDNIAEIRPSSNELVLSNNQIVKIGAKFQEEIKSYLNDIGIM